MGLDWYGFGNSHNYPLHLHNTCAIFCRLGGGILNPKKEDVGFRFRSTQPTVPFFLGWVEGYLTQRKKMLGFAFAQPNLRCHFFSVELRDT
jgi:hypothetical protein